MTPMRRVALHNVATIERNIVNASDIKAGVLFVGLENIESGGRFTNVHHVDAGELASSKFAFTSRHVLFGKLRPYLAKIARPDFEGVCSTDILPVLPGPELDRGYLTWYLLSPEMVSLAASRATGANLPRLSPNALAEMTIPLPPLPQQQRIADILDKADALRTKRRAVIAQLGALTQSIFLDMFGDPVTNPKAWPRHSLNECAKVTYGFPFNSQYFGADGSLKLVRIRDVVRGNSDTFYSGHEPFEERHRVKDGDILVGMDGEFNCAKWAGGAGLLNQRVCKIEVIDASLHADFLYRALPSFLKRIEAETPFVTVKHLSAKQLGLIQIPHPPVGLQGEFARHAMAIERLDDAACISASTLDGLFASVEYRAFRGELLAATPSRITA